jgi:uncharacterized protein (TIGR03086 family)
MAGFSKENSFMTSPTRLSADYGQSDSADPRLMIARAIQAARTVTDSLSASEATLKTPCAEWTALDVARHMIAVIDRATAGATGAPLDAMPVLADVDHGDLIRTLDSSSSALQAAWANDATLTAMVTVPWGSFPGAVVLSVYAADLLVHAWDLAVAINVEMNWPEGDVVASLAMAKVGFPDNSREGMPFGTVISAAPESPAIDHLAGWVGRDVQKWRMS